MGKGIPSVRVGGLVLRLAACLLLTSCVGIADRDPVASKNATDLKVEVQMLLPKAIEPAALHEQAINFVKLRSLQGLEYAKSLKDNDLTIRQWSILVDENGQLLGGFLRRWEASPTGLKPLFVQEAGKNIDLALDEIVRLENAK